MDEKKRSNKSKKNKRNIIGDNVAEKIHAGENKDNNRYTPFISKGSKIGKKFGVTVGEKAIDYNKEESKERVTEQKGLEIGKKISKDIGRKAKPDNFSKKINVSAKFNFMGYNIGKKIFERDERDEMDKNN